MQFGSSGLSLADLNGNNGFVINGAIAGGNAGFSVGEAGDVNNDGVDDVVVSAYLATTPNGILSGASYVVFGSGSGFDDSLELADLNGSNGFSINGLAGGDFFGRSVSAAGDINGDRIDDIIISAPRATVDGKEEAGESYVIFGSGDGFSDAVDLATLDGSNGFVIRGIETYDGSGSTVSEAGDINGDGFDDVIIGASNSEQYGPGISDGSYVVFGSGEDFAPTLDLADLDGTNGFTITSEEFLSNLGADVSSAGDINGDGIDDVILSSTYVVFGQRAGFGETFELTNLDGENGFALSPGNAVSSAGDVNADGIDDIIVGARGNSTNGTRAGAAYVVFGSTEGFDASIDLEALDGSDGFVFNGAVAEDTTGSSVSGVGDINGDGIDDVAIGGTNANRYAGITYVLYGSDTGFESAIEVADLDGGNGFVLEGLSPGDFFGNAVSSAGDINADGADDLIVGAFRADANGEDSGASYVLFGPIDGAGDPNEDDVLVGTNGPDALNGFGGNDIINGKNGDDALLGGEGDDVITAGGGTDEVDGQGGDDTIFGGNSSDVLRGGSGNDTINGGNNGDFVSGDAGDDTLLGGGGNDSLQGEDGNDILSGGRGRDLLRGGAGQDLFVLETGSGAAVVLDFVQGEDKLQLGAGVSVKDLSFRQEKITITSTGDILAKLTNTDTTSLSEADFVNG